MAYRFKGLIVILALLAAACPGSPPPQAPIAKPAPPAAGPPEKVVWRTSKSGLGFRLSNADPERPERAKLAPAQPLDDKASKQVFARLPGFKAEAQAKSFAMRSKSIPAPRPGETVKTEFPPRASAGPPPAVAGGPLRVLRHAPEGDVQIAPNLAVTFSEPMVAVSSHADVARETIPLRLRPEPAGRWRWVGTQTVFFEPKGERFPMATEYVVEVPAGTRAASGRTLDQAITWTFKTPALDLTDMFPERWGDPVDLEPVIFAAFNQRIDQAALLRELELRSDRSAHALRLATAEEIEKDEDARRLSQGAEPNRWIALKPVEPLPKGSTVNLVVPVGTPSAEGPRRTQAEQREQFRIRGALRLEDVSCGWDDGCPPLAGWTARFTNAIDAATFEDSMVRVHPELPGMKIDVSGRHLTLRGRSKGRTRYTVTFSSGVKDVFGQSLEQPATDTIDVTEAEPFLFPEQDEMLVLDPAFGPKLSVYSVNRSTLTVKLYAVQPADWPRYLRYRHDYDWDGRVTQPPGKLVATRTVKPKGERDELVETQIDLGPALNNGFGQVIAVVEPPNQPKPKNRWDYRERQWVRAWVQVTQLGLTAFHDGQDVNAWITDLGTGAAAPEATVSAEPGERTAKTGPDGVARLALGQRGDRLVARRGQDLVFVPGSSETDTFVAQPKTEQIRWFVFDDRKLYKPGEKLHAKGWVRLQQTGKHGDLGRIGGGNHQVHWTVLDPRGAELGKGVAPLDDSDGFHLAFELPKNANLGSATLRLALDQGGWDRQHSHGFQIEEFKRPEFEVDAQVSEGPHYVGKHALATVSGTYFAGGGLPDAEVEWRVAAEDGHFTPPNRDRFHFGKPRRFGWWGLDDAEARKAQESWKAKTDGEGRHRLRIDFDALEPAYPRQIQLEANLTDVNRQSWSARSSVLVHPADVTVGLREESQLLKAGSNIQLDVIVTDIEGAAVAGRSVSIRSARIERTWRGRKMQEKESDPETCAVTSGSDVVRCSLPTRAGGQHRITAIVADVHGRKSQTRLDVYVLGDDPPENPTVGRDRVDLIVGKKEYASGETAKLLVSAPFAPAEGVLTLRRDGVVRLERFRLERRTQTLDVKLDPAFIPNVHAHVTLVGSRVREAENGEPDPGLPRRPAFASGEIGLSIPPKDRSLSIRVTPEKKALEPGGTTRIGVQIQDAAGRPVPGAAAALVVVDESVLALAGYELPDPLAVLYPARSAGVSDYELRARVALMRPDTARHQPKAKAKPNKNGKELASLEMRTLGAAANGGGAGSGSHRVSAPKMRMAVAETSMKDAKSSAKPMPSAVGAAGPPPAQPARGEPPPEIKVRSDFDPLAAFVPRLTTDATGRASASVKLPDNLTRYRVVAVAAAGENRFGKQESDVTARLPLMVRPAAPRFLNFGDRFSLPVVLQNQTARAVTVDVVARAANAKLLEPDALRVQVPANDRVEVRFPAAAGEPGTARFQIGAVSPIGVDAAEIELPVWTPATTEAFATYGALDHGAVSQPVRMPSAVYTEVGQLELTTSSTALAGLTDAVLYLVRYPFDCNEQIASRMLAIVALKDVLGAFQAQGLPSKQKLVATIAADVELLGRRQHYSGGWDYWRQDRQPDPYVSVHVAHALVRAKGKGFAVPQPLLDRALRYLHDIRHHFPWWYSEEARRVVRAYALGVRHRAGQAVGADARALFKEVGGVKGMPMDGIGWLLPVLSKDRDATEEVAAIRRDLENKITETAGKAHFVTHVSDSAHVILESSRRTDGILLEAVIEDRPELDAIPKLAQGLLAHRKRGRWLNTQENVFILLALDRYFATYEKATPDFVARAWLGPELAAEHPFRGRSVDRQHVEVPLSYLARTAQPSNLVVAKEGQGRLYYRIGMQYVPKDLRPPPAEHGFSVSRLYEGADDPNDVRRDKDGSWRVKLGSRVRVRVAMVAPARRYHVALVDPIPAGFEPMNAALKMTGSIPRDPKKEDSKKPWWWSHSWYEHQNLRDERVEAFTSLLYGGTYDYVYVARATTPGEFVVPPPKAEEMYDPETFGRGAGDKVIVE